MILAETAGECMPVLSDAAAIVRAGILAWRSDMSQALTVISVILLVLVVVLLVLLLLRQRKESADAALRRADAGSRTRRAPAARRDGPEPAGSGSELAAGTRRRGHGHEGPGRLDHQRHQPDRAPAEGPVRHLRKAARGADRVERTAHERPSDDRRRSPQADADRQRHEARADAADRRRDGSPRPWSSAWASRSSR